MVFVYQPLCCCELKLIWLPNLVSDFRFSFVPVPAVGSCVYTIVSLVSSSLEGFLHFSSRLWQSFFFPFCAPESCWLAMLSWFLSKTRRSLSGCHLLSLSIILLSLFPGMERTFFLDIRARLLQTPGDVDSFHSGARSPDKMGMLFGAGANVERGGKSPHFEAHQVYFCHNLSG